MSIEELRDIKGLGKILLSSAPLPKQMIELKDRGVDFPYLSSIRDVAYIRLHTRNKSGTRTCHAVISARDSLNILVRVSPLLENISLASEAVKEAHVRRIPFVTKDKSVYERYVWIAEYDKDATLKERRAIFIPNEHHVITIGSESAKFLFGDMREKYFERFARGSGFNFYLVEKSLVNQQEGTVISYVWFKGIDRADIDAYLNNLHLEGRALAILRE